MFSETSQGWKTGNHLPGCLCDSQEAAHWVLVKLSGGWAPLGVPNASDSQRPQDQGFGKDSETRRRALTSGSGPPLPSTDETSAHGKGEMFIYRVHSRVTKQSTKGEILSWKALNRSMAQERSEWENTETLRVLKCPPPPLLKRNTIF